MRFFLLKVIFFASIIYSFSQEEEGRRIVKELCSEKYYGRGYLKQGDSLAAEFLANEFKKRKIKPLKKNYFQAFEHTVNIFPTDVRFEVNGENLILGKDFLPDPSSNSANLKWNYIYIDKSILFNTKKLEEAIKKIQDGEFNSCIFSYVNLAGDSLKKAKGLQHVFNELCPVICLTKEKFTYSVSNEQQKYALIYVKEGLIKVGDSISTQLTAYLKKSHISRNVIAYLPAPKKTKKTIALTAHYDHLGGIGNSCYFPGGNDNASGTSLLFTLADEFQTIERDFNVLLIAFAGEEAGLLGSKHFVDHPKIDLDKLTFLINLDIMGSGEDGITVVNATEYTKAFDLLVNLNQEKGYLKTIKKRGKAANSDHYWFSEKGVPSFFIYTMGPNKNYHDVFDTYEALTFSEYNDLVKLIKEFIVKI